MCTSRMKNKNRVGSDKLLYMKKVQAVKCSSHQLNEVKANATQHSINTVRWNINNDKDEYNYVINTKLSLPIATLEQ